MKLNAEIIYERLGRHYPVEMYGRGSRKLLLQPPELYIDNTNRFCENHVYLATVEHLPHRPYMEKNVTVICIGESRVLDFYKEHAAVLVIRRKVDFYEVYQTLRQIYDTFSRWESGALELFLAVPSIDEVLRCAYPAFERPMIVLDSAFQFTASCGTWDALAAERDTRGALDPEQFLAFLREKDVSMDIHGPILLEMTAGSYLCVNLFSAEDEYIGCLCIDQQGKRFPEGENALAELLAKMVERVCQINPSLLNHDRSTLRDALRQTMNEKPLGRSQKLFLRSANHTREYGCVSIHSLKPFSALPVGYICSVFEGIFADSLFFEYHNTLLGLIPAEELSRSSLPGAGHSRLTEILADMQLCLGISNSFSDLYLLRTYYQQAEAAIENGLLYGRKESIYRFSDYALAEMVTNSLGGLPAEVYFPAGMRELLSHDKDGSISYWETLKVFLEENMSYARASRRLYIHRSTLVERIERIERELSADLTDPDQRLQLELLLKAMEIERIAREKQ